MNRIFSVLFIVYFFVLALIYLGLALVVCLITRRSDPTKLALHRLSALFMRRLLWVSPFWRCEIEGQENVVQGEPYVIVANHQSLADIVILFGLEHNFKWVARRSLFKFPIFGACMSINDHVPVAATDLSSTRSMMRVCHGWLKQGVSILIFPEGTRSPDGDVHTFYEGAFRLANLCNVRVLPIAITGTHDVLPKGSKLLNIKGDMHIKIMPPLSVADFGGSTERMKNYVQNLIKREVEGQKKETPSVIHAA